MLVPTDKINYSLKFIYLNNNFKKIGTMYTHLPDDIDRLLEKGEVIVFLHSFKSWISLIFPIISNVEILYRDKRIYLDSYQYKYLKSNSKTALDIFNKLKSSYKFKNNTLTLSEDRFQKEPVKAFYWLFLILFTIGLFPTIALSFFNKNFGEYIYIESVKESNLNEFVETKVITLEQKTIKQRFYSKKEGKYLENPKYFIISRQNKNLITIYSNKLDKITSVNTESTIKGKVQRLSDLKFSEIDQIKLDLNKKSISSLNYSDLIINLDFEKGNYFSTLMPFYINLILILSTYISYKFYIEFRLKKMKSKLKVKLKAKKSKI